MGVKWAICRAMGSTVVGRGKDAKAKYRQGWTVDASSGPIAGCVNSAPFPKNPMATVRTITLEYVSHDGASGLSSADRLLLQEAAAAADRAYAPYSKFHVGAALRMADGTVVTGNNQENASFPAGICAERTAIHAAMSRWPQGVVTEMAIMVPSVTGERPVSPCGICRQALLEQEHRQGAPIRLLMATSGNAVHELASAAALLPLSFDASFLQP